MARIITNMSIVNNPKLEKDLKDIALQLTVHCVRNSIIEDYHANGQLSQADMKAFNKEVVNKVYTFLTILLNPKYQRVAQSPAFARVFRTDNDWDRPELDEEFLEALRLAEKLELDESETSYKAD